MPQKVKCKFCSKREEKNHSSIIQCATCRGYCHASCLELPKEIISTVRTYDWQCNDCKYCYHCHDIVNEEQILFCDTCDRGYHMYCAKPKLKRKPKGDWFCPICVENHKNADQMEVDQEEEEKQKEHDAKTESSDKNIEGDKPTKDQDVEKIDYQNVDAEQDDVPLTKIAQQTPSSSSTNHGGNQSTERHTKNALSTTLSTHKYYNSPSKTCPFPGCDGSGNVKPASSLHFSLNACPLAREEKKRERELLGLTRTESPRKTPEGKENPKEKSSNSASSTTTTAASSSKILCEEDRNTPLSSNSDPVAVAIKSTQTPIEHIVSNSDLDMFQKARERAAEIMALEKEMIAGGDDKKIAVFGEIEVEAWYKSHYPLEFLKHKRVYICEFCLGYFKSETLYKRHMEKCTSKFPPGDEIYRKDNLSVFEVDGKLATIYCQNLCLFAKLFLDHKTLWNDVAPFLFYVMTVCDNRGCNLIGYFSKEKNSFLNYNVSCILVLPQHMRQGYGKLLIDFSYLLSKTEGKAGSPERPLSDLGLMSYRNYWQDRLIDYLLDYDDEQITIKELSEKMALNPTDVISTLQFLGMLKYWKGKHLILLKKEIIEEYSKKVQRRPEDYKVIDPNCLSWKPNPNPTKMLKQ